METQPKWTVSLANGETLYEGKNEYEHIEGEDSPWQKLLKHIEKEETEITSLALYNDIGQRWNLPSAGKNPKFQAFRDAEDPKDFKFRRKLGVERGLMGGETKEDRYIMIEANYGDKRLQIWVSEDGKNSWTLVL